MDSSQGSGLWFERSRQAELLLPNLQQAVQGNEQEEVKRIMQVICGVLTEGNRLVETMADVNIALRIYVQLGKLKKQMQSCLRSNQSGGENRGDDEGDRGGPPFSPVPVVSPSSGSDAVAIPLATYTDEVQEIDESDQTSSKPGDGGNVTAA